MKTYILYWLDGTTQKISGTSITDAFMRAGYGAGALSALDYYKEEKSNINFEGRKQK